MTLSEELSNRVPAEIWHAIAAVAINPYDILLIDGTSRSLSNEPLNEVNINNNDIQKILKLCRVSKAFKAGIHSAFRKNFSGHLYFWFGNFRPEICTFVKTKLASQVKQLDIHMSSSDIAGLLIFRSEWSQFIRSGGFPDLQEVRVFAPHAVDYNRLFDLSWGDEEDPQTTEAVARIKSMVATAGLDASIPATFRIYAYIRDDDLVSLGIDTTGIGLTGRAIADQWRRRCDVPVSCQRLEWLWSETEEKATSSREM